MITTASNQGTEECKPNCKAAWQGVPRAHPGVNDKLFTSDLIAYMRDKFCIDNSRIYASGKSDGGGFVGTLACSPDHGGDFAAFAAASGAFYTNVDAETPCHPARSPLPILEFHGTADIVIPYDGGSRHKEPLPSIPHWLARWAGHKRNGCEGPKSNVTDSEGLVWNTTYICDGEPLVQSYMIEGMGHDWPSMQKNDDNKGENYAPIEGTTVMMEFFQNDTKLS